MKKIDPDFRANSERSISVFGEFNEALVNRLAPEILKLRTVSNDPITVFINSSGGSTRVLDFIIGLLKTKGVSGPAPRVITVAVGFARSAAANLLALGDYAIAYPKAGIHFHGVRYMEIGDPVTMESASSMAEQLQNANRMTASMLAEAGTERLAFHYAFFKNEFEEIRKNIGLTASDIECFSFCLKRHLSSNGEALVDRAIDRWRSLRELSEKVLTAARTAGKAGLEFEADVLRGIIDFEVNKNKGTEWCLNATGISQVMKDYLLLRDYDMGKHTALIKRMIERFPYAFFEDEEMALIEAASKEASPPEKLVDLTKDKMNQKIKPFCYFTTSIWQGLQEDENPLSPRDAYWLGAIDEVYDSNLPCMRQVMEADDETSDSVKD